MFNRHPRPKDANTSILRRLYRQAINYAQSVDSKAVDFLAGLSRKRAGALAEHNRHRQQVDGHWFTADEYSLVAVLASLIVPSNEDGPGAKEAEVVEWIDRVVAKSQDSQIIYARGLLALDEWAQHDYRCSFTQMSHEQQVDLLTEVDRLREKLSRTQSRIAKIKNRLLVRYYQVNGLFWAVKLFPRLVSHVLRAFYSSRVCWDWLGYDGPPMPYGYPDLIERRSPTAKLEFEKRSSTGGRP
jgi:hypothetical protein